MDERPDEGELLLALQRADSTVLRLTKLIDDLPEQREMASIDERLTVIANTADDVTVEHAEILSRQRREERELDQLAARLDAESARLYDGSITTSRENQAVEAEIGQTTRRISDHEDLLLAIMEELDTSSAQLAALQSERDALEARKVLLADSLQVAAAQHRVDRDEALSARKNLFLQLSAELRERYTTIAERSGGVGAGELIDGSCSACRISLAHADMDELLKGPPIATCPSCRRLLVIPPWKP
ncbi:MAG: C4-type zinc ribbon domain-containing protein [Nitriliruptoraceae bacterium]